MADNLKLDVWKNENKLKRFPLEIYFKLVLYA